MPEPNAWETELYYSSNWAYVRLILIAVPALLLGACISAPPAQQSHASVPAPPLSVSGTVPTRGQMPTITDAQRAAFKRGVAAVRAGNGVVSVRVFADLAKQLPQSAAVQTNLGSAYMLQGNGAAAIAAYQRAIALNPWLATPHLRLGVLYRRAGQLKKAEAQYKAALEASPNNRLAHLNLGILYDVYLPKPAKALSHYKSFQSLSDQPDKEVATWITELKQRL